MLNWLTRLFRPRLEAPPQRRPTSAVLVTLDDKIITVDNGQGSVDIMTWSDLANVTVLTTGSGPFVVDLFWILTNREGRQTITVPMGACGEHDLVQAMQMRLPGFDNMAVIEAMSSTEIATFQIWPPLEIF